MKGQYQGSVWTSEYQKRGLPQLHLLQFLRPQDRDRLPDPAVVDRLISAEMPRPVSDPDGRLTEVGRKMMVHGPCGVYNPSAPCMVSSRPPTCSKVFLKAFCEMTIVREDGYPEYRRHDFLQNFTVGSALLDNRWIVPHNPYLSRKYNAHINVEVYPSVRTVKYIHKYIYKGTDTALLFSLPPTMTRSISTCRATRAMLAP